MDLEIYTDGGCEPNPGQGSWAYVVVEDEKIIFTESGSEKDTTNNRMEMKAILNAANYLIENKSYRAIIYSDSQYAINSFTVWCHKWVKNNFKGKKNIDLVKEGMELFKTFQGIKLKFVKGHNGNEYNELADSLCSEEINKT